MLTYCVYKNNAVETIFWISAQCICMLNALGIFCVSLRRLFSCSDYFPSHLNIVVIDLLCQLSHASSLSPLTLSVSLHADILCVLLLKNTPLLGLFLWNWLYIVYKVWVKGKGNASRVRLFSYMGIQIIDGGYCQRLVVKRWVFLSWTWATLH